MNTTGYDRIAAAIRYLTRHRKRQPELAELAAHIGLSQSHLHRLFSRWAGVTPKRFLEFLTVQHAKKLLDGSESVLATAHGSGLSGPGRLHDHFVTVEAVTPGEYRSRGAGLTIRFGTGESPFGPVFVAWTERGVCRVGFVADGGCFRREGGSPPGLGAGVARRRRIEGDSTGAVHLLGALRSRESPADRPCARDQLSTGRLARPCCGCLRGASSLTVAWQKRSAARRRLGRRGARLAATRSPSSFRATA